MSAYFEDGIERIDLVCLLLGSSAVSLVIASHFLLHGIGSVWLVGGGEGQKQRLVMSDLLLVTKFILRKKKKQDTNRPSSALINFVKPGRTVITLFSQFLMFSRMRHGRCTLMNQVRKLWMSLP